MAEAKVEEGKFLARCAHCGKWREVAPQSLAPELFFSRWQATFRCCEKTQTAAFTLEKDEIDVH